MANNQKNKQAALLAQMGKRLDQAEQPSAALETPQPPPAKPATTGKSERINISLHPEDIEIIKQHSAFFAAQGLPTNVSLVIKSAIRAVQPGDALLEAHSQARALDLRSKKRKQPA